MCRGHVRGQRSRTSCLCLSASSSPSSSRMPSSSRAAGAEFLGLGVHVSGWRSARRCAPAALQLLRQMSRQHFDQRTQPAWHWDPQCEGLSVHLVTNKTCLVEFTVCPLKAGLGVFVSGTTGPRHAPTQINTPPIGGFYAHKKPELGSGRYLLTGHAVRGFFCCCRLKRQGNTHGRQQPPRIPPAYYKEGLVRFTEKRSELHQPWSKQPQSWCYLGPTS